MSDCLHLLRDQHVAYASFRASTIRFTRHPPPPRPPFPSSRSTPPASVLPGRFPALAASPGAVHSKAVGFGSILARISTGRIKSLGAASGDAQRRRPQQPPPRSVGQTHGRRHNMRGRRPPLRPRGTFGALALWARAMGLQQRACSRVSPGAKRCIRGHCREAKHLCSVLLSCRHGSSVTRNVPVMLACVCAWQSVLCPDGCRRQPQRPVLAGVRSARETQHSMHRLALLPGRSSPDSASAQIALLPAVASVVSLVSPFSRE